MLKADLHIHSEYSMDCNTPLEQIVNRCLELGINCIAIADHGTAEGALKIQATAPFKVIVAEEIITPHGEIMGMFLKETIPSWLPIEQAISRIKAQGGLVCIPHPFDTFRRSALNARVMDKILDQIDIVEVFNARAILSRGSNQAQAFARKHGLPGSAGSDAHTLSEIGRAYVEIPEFNGRDDFIQSLAGGRIMGQRSSPFIHFFSLAQSIKSRFK